VQKSEGKKRIQCPPYRIVDPPSPLKQSGFICAAESTIG
jgi:hypothetical protein